MTTQVIQIIVAALTGGLAGAFVRYFLDRRSEKRRAVLDFYWRVFLEREFRKHFHYVRPIRVAWPQDKSVLQHFLDLPSDQKPKETECPNDLTPHQNLSILLNFWGVLYVSLRDGALDESLTRSLFGNVWQWQDRKSVVKGKS